MAPAWELDVGKKESQRLSLQLLVLFNWDGLCNCLILVKLSNMSNHLIFRHPVGCFDL
jgi:hypothetical protein